MDVGIVRAGGRGHNTALDALAAKRIMEPIGGAKCATVNRAARSRKMDYTHGTAEPEVPVGGEMKDCHHSWNINNDQTKSVESRRSPQ